MNCEYLTTIVLSKVVTSKNVNSKYVPTHTSKHTIIAVAESNTNTMPNLISMYVTTLGISKCVMAAST